MYLSAYIIAREAIQRYFMASGGELLLFLNLPIVICASNKTDDVNVSIKPVSSSDKSGAREDERNGREANEQDRRSFSD